MIFETEYGHVGRRLQEAAELKARYDELVKCALGMAHYLDDKEDNDYQDACAENNRDRYSIDVDGMWHVYQHALYARHLTGELLPGYTFFKKVKL